MTRVVLVALLVSASATQMFAQFTDPMVHAIIQTGHLSDEYAARALTDIVTRRRDKVVKFWITQTNPLDRFEVVHGGTEQRLTFDNAAIRVNAAPPGATYTARWHALNNMTGAEHAIGDELTLQERSIKVSTEAFGPADDAGDRYAVVAIRTFHRGFPQWERPVRVTVRMRLGAAQVVGIDRPR